MTVFVVEIPDTTPLHVKPSNGKTDESCLSCCHAYCLPSLKYYKVVVFVLLLLGVMAIVYFYTLSSEKFDHWRKSLIAVFFVLSFLLGVFTQCLYADVKDVKPHGIPKTPNEFYPEAGAVKYPSRHYEFILQNPSSDDAFPPPAYDDDDKQISKYHTTEMPWSTTSST